MAVDVTARATARQLAFRAASRAEQEIRAYPRAYDLFYRVLTRSSGVRRAVGRVKSGVRGGGADAQPSDWPLTAADRRRAVATAVRLGLSSEHGA